MTVQPKSPTVRHRGVLLTLLLAMAVMAGAYGLYVLSGRWLAASWQEQLETVPEEQIKILVDRIAQMEENGLPVLVQALDSPRESVARAAKRRLWQAVDQWQGLRNRDASRKAVALAQVLADRVDGLSLVGRQNAADVAARILDWPINDEVVRARNVMAACERVIRMSNLPQPVWSARAGSRVRSLAPGDEPILESARRSAADAPQGAIKQLTYLSGGGLPIVSSLSAPAEDAASMKRSAEQSGRTENAAKQAAKTPLQPGEQEPATLEPVGGRPLPKAASPAGWGLFGRNAAPQKQESLNPKQLLLTDTVELMRRLRSEDVDSVAAAQQELQRRGFSEVHFELARQLFDPDPEVRKQLVRMLPQLRSVNATPWLVWLCRDRDADVRLLAITVLATSNDPGVIAQVERIARLDDDPRIQDQARRLARHRDEKK